MNAPIASTALGRRSLLAGFAALPVAGMPFPSLASAADPFAGYHAEVEALHEAINGCADSVASDPLMDRWSQIDAEAMAGQPTTFAGAAGALEYARREFVQFHIEPRVDGGSKLDPGDRLILHLIDGAIAVLRQATGGGLA